MRPKRRTKKPVSYKISLDIESDPEPTPMALDESSASEFETAEVEVDEMDDVIVDDIAEPEDDEIMSEPSIHSATALAWGDTAELPGVSIDSEAEEDNITLKIEQFKMNEKFIEFNDFLLKAATYELITMCPTDGLISLGNGKKGRPAATPEKHVSSKSTPPARKRARQSSGSSLKYVTPISTHGTPEQTYNDDIIKSEDLKEESTENLKAGTPTTGRVAQARSASSPNTPNTPKTLNSGMRESANFSDDEVENSTSTLEAGIRLRDRKSVV